MEKEERWRRREVDGRGKERWEEVGEGRGGKGGEEKREGKRRLDFI
jgi:hypothetical protein